MGDTVKKTEFKQAAKFWKQLLWLPNSDVSSNPKSIKVIKSAMV